MSHDDLPNDGWGQPEPRFSPGTGCALALMLAVPFWLGVGLIIWGINYIFTNWR